MIDLGPLRPQADKRVVQREISGKVYQFVLRKARERTDFMYRLAAVSDLIAVAKEAWSADIPAGIVGKKSSELSELERAAINKALLSAAPNVIKRLADPQYREIVYDLINWSQVQSPTNGTFEDLSNDAVYERAFSEDMAAQFGVAFTALEVNFGDFFRKVIAALPSDNAATTAHSDD